MRRLYFFCTGGVAIGVALSGSTGLHRSKDLFQTVCAVLPYNGNGHDLAVGEQRRNILTLNNLSDRIGVVHIFYIQRIEQCLPVLIITFQRNDAVKAVDAQFYRRINVYADFNRRRKIQPVTAKQQQSYARESRGKDFIFCRSFSPVTLGFSETYAFVLSFNPLSACTCSKASLIRSSIFVTSQLFPEQLPGTGQECIDCVCLFP